MKREIFLIVIIILLSITSLGLFQDNRELNLKIDSYENFVASTSVDFLARDVVMPILSEEELDVSKLYEIKGRLYISHAFIVRTFGKESHRGDYIFKTIKGIEKLIELIEANGSKESINKVVEETIDLQKEIFDRYDVGFEK